ncbi:hypothetical protein [Nonomuraea insulae]|uniref:Uncharacterized protein n=1 Tax=Nonomuraea insulae TaxID=1616787 RepID=A0ABW1CXE5_9ACTN
MDGRRVAVQIGLAWAAGVIIAPVFFYGVVHGALMGGVIGLQLAGVAIALGAVGLLFLLAGASRGTTGLTSEWGWRVWWAILVFAGGIAAWGFGLAMYSKLGLSPGPGATLPALVAGGAGFGLSAAILAGWRLRRGARGDAPGCRRQGPARSPERS